MNGEQNRPIERAGRFDDRGESLRIVGIARAVKRHQVIPALLHALLIENTFPLVLQGQRENVEHDISDEMNAGSDPLSLQVLDCRWAGAEVQRRDVVGNDAIDLLGHRPVE